MKSKIFGSGFSAILISTILISTSLAFPAWGRSLETLTLQKKIAKAIAPYRGRLSGTLLVTTPMETVSVSIDLANDDTGLSNGPDVQYLIASNTKQFVATAILLLEDRGLLRITDPLSLYFPEYPSQRLVGSNGKVVTLEHLMQHTSGIFEAYEDPTLANKIYKVPITFKEILGTIMNRPLVSAPGQVMNYGDIGFLLLGEVVRRVSGQSFADFAKQNLFLPAGMLDTSCGYPADLTRVARSYERFAPHLKRHRVDFRREYEVEDEQMGETFTDGNIVSTAHDMAKWAKALTEGRILSPAALQKAFNPSMASVKAGEPYGLGWVIGLDRVKGHLYSHTGVWLNYYSKILIMPDSNESIIWLGNEIPEGGDREAFFKRVFDALKQGR